MIKINEISKSYGKTRVLSGVTLDIPAGKIIGIVGANGAGKTTLFNCIANKIRYLGTISSPYGQLKNTIGFLPTNPQYLSHLTGEEYMELASRSRGITHDSFSVLNIFELPLNRYASQYSSGMKKKLAFTSILSQGNDVFILDEPFNGVDINSNILILEIIKKMKEAGKYIIISSHIFGSLVSICDQIHLLQNGNISMSEERDGFHKIEEEMIRLEVKSKIENLNLF